MSLIMVVPVERVDQISVELKKEGFSADYGPLLTNLTVKLVPPAASSNGLSLIPGVEGKLRLTISIHCTLEPKPEICSLIPLIVA